MQEIEFLSIRERIKQIKIPSVDMVIGVATGGTVPAALVAYEIGRPLMVCEINYRDEANVPRYTEPRVRGAISVPRGVRRVLLVDDVAVSGKTLNAAKALLPDLEIVTLVCKAKAGTADIILFPDMPGCVMWPWKMYADSRNERPENAA